MADLTRNPGVQVRPPHTGGELSTMDKVWDRTLKALVPTSIGIAGWLMSVEMRVSDVEARTTLITATRFSNADAAAMRADLIELIAKQEPPRWLTLAVARIEAAAESTKGAQQEILQRMSALEQRVK